MIKSLDNLQHDLADSALKIEIALQENLNLSDSQLVGLHADILQAVGVIRDLWDIHLSIKKYGEKE